MGVNPDLRNQHTTLSATQAKNAVRAHCEECGAGLDRKKRFCLPCSDLKGEEYRRIYLVNKSDPFEQESKKEKPGKDPAHCCDCGVSIKVFGTRKRCGSCDFTIKSERARIRAARRTGHRHRLTDLELPVAIKLRDSGMRTDQIAKEMKLSEAAVANGLWADRFGEDGVLR